MDGDGEARAKGYEELPRPKQRKKNMGEKIQEQENRFPSAGPGVNCLASHPGSTT